MLMSCRPGAAAKPIRWSKATSLPTRTSPPSSLPHYEPLTVSGTYVTPYGNLSNEYGLNLPPDDYMPPSTIPEPVYTAGLGTSMEQTPLPITLSGTVFNDMNADNKQETGDLGIAGVQLSLYELDNSGNYVADGKTATTDANGNYEFRGCCPAPTAWSRRSRMAI